MKPTNFSYFLEKYPFNVIETADLYPVQMRPGDIELNLDKAMTMLTIAEDQMVKVLSPIPFLPTDFGFIEKIAEGDNEHQQTAIYFREDNPLYTLEADVAKAMTYEAIKYKDCEESDDAFDFIPEFSVNIFLPNAVIGNIVLQSIGFLPIHNPTGYYENKVSMPDEISTEPITEIIKPDTSIPVKIWPPTKFATVEEREAFELENDFATTKNLFLADSALAAMGQIRTLRNQYSEYTFTNVEEAIEAHPMFTDAQKNNALSIWRQDVPYSKGDTVPEVPVKETKPVEPCSHCKGTGQTGVNLQCLWCEGTGRELHKTPCETCEGSGLDPFNGPASFIPCGDCKGTGIKPEN